MTALVGASDRGKSAVVRALYWLTFNEPAGIDYRTHGTTEVRVEAVMDDGTTVARFRSNSENGYSLDPKGCGAVVRWDKVGRNVPQDVTETLGLLPLNFHLQHDSPFLIGLRPAEAGRVVNELVDLSLIDSSLRCLTAGLRAAKTNVEANASALSAARTDIAALEVMDLPAKASKLRLMSGILANYKHRESQIVRLEELTTGLEAEPGVEQEAARLVVAEDSLNRIRALHRNVFAKAKEVEGLTEIGNQIARASSAAWPTARLHHAEERLQAMDEVAEEAEALTNLIVNLTDLEALLSSTAAEASAAAAEAERLAAQAPRRCPTCGQSLDLCKGEHKDA